MTDLERHQRALNCVDRSFLSDEAKQGYRHVLTDSQQALREEA